MLRKLTDKTSKLNLFHTDKRSFVSSNRDFDYLANSIMRDFDRTFNREFGSQFFEHRSPLLHDPYYEPVRSSYQKKTITTGEDGRSVVKTVRELPGKPWETSVEEYMDNKKLEANKSEALERQKAQTIDQASNEQTNAQQHTSHQSVQSGQVSKMQNDQTVTQHHNNDVLNEFDREFRQLSNSITRDFDNFFGTRSSFDDLWSWSPRWRQNSDSIFLEPENTTYRLKTVINKNGDVIVKTAFKDPGSEWQTSVQHYNKNKSVEGGKTQETIAETQKNESREAGKTEKEQGETEQIDSK